MTLPKNHYITINDHQIHYLDWGNPSAPPLVLLHGLCGNAHYWDFFATIMADSHHVIAIDQRGHGDSQWAHEYGPRDYVADLEEFVSRLELTDIVLIGHSLGGINAILFAALYPDLVSKLVIIDIGPEIGSAGAERMLNEMTCEPDSFQSITEAAEYLKTVQPRYSETFVQHLVAHSLKHTDTGQLIFKFDTALRQTRMNSPEWLWEYLSMLVTPSLLLRGTESDVLLRDTAEIMMNSTQFAQYAEINMAGHSIPGDSPHDFELAVRDFLAVSNE